MNSEIEFHDSDVSYVRASEGSVEVLFAPAYVHVSRGQPGVDPGEGHLQDVLFRFESAQVYGDPEAFAGWVIDGSLDLNDVSRGMVAVPFAASGSVKLTLVLDTSATLEVVAQSVEVLAVSPGQYLEHFSP